MGILEGKWLHDKYGNGVKHLNQLNIKNQKIYVTTE